VAGSSTDSLRHLVGDGVLRRDDHTGMDIGFSEPSDGDEGRCWTLAIDEPCGGSEVSRNVDGPSGGKYVGLAALERARQDQSGGEDDKDDDTYNDGLMFGLTIWHFRMLQENPWEGGGGYTPQEVAQFTPDQVYCRCADLKVLQAKEGTGVSKVSSEEAVAMVDGDGKVAGRTKGGEPLNLPLKGKGSSLAQNIREQDQRKKPMGLKRRRRRAARTAAWRRSDGGMVEAECPKCDQPGRIVGRLEGDLGRFVCPAMDCDFAGDILLEGITDGD